MIKQDKSNFHHVTIQTDNGVVTVCMTDEEHEKVFSEIYGIEVMAEKKQLIKALKRGDYVIGIDCNPMRMCNVFHYENDAFETFSFSDVLPDTATPLRLKRNTIFYSSGLQIDSMLDALPHYDKFVVSKKGNLLNTQDIIPATLKWLLASYLDEED